MGTKTEFGNAILETQDTPCFGKNYLYKNYINGTYNNSLSLKVGEKAYDKLNRRYYRSAKQAGMTAPNYIMTYIVGNS